MSSGSLALLARLSEAASFPAAVRAYESDPWGYLRRKLLQCEEPLRAYKQELFERHREALLSDLREPFLKPGVLLDHKEVFEKLLPVSEFADLAFHLAPGGDAAQRLEGARAVVSSVQPKTLFDVESWPVERRGKAWEALVGDTSRRLRLDQIEAILKRAEATPFRRAMLARRLRRNLAQFLEIARNEAGIKEQLTLFILTRVEAAIAACLRLVK